MTSVWYSRPRRRVDGQIRHRPLPAVRLPPLHPLGDGVLMRAGKRGEHQRPAVRLTLIDMHAGRLLIGPADAGQVGEIQLRVHALRVQVERKRHQVHIAGALAVAKQRPFDAVRAGEQAHLRVGHGAPAVVVRVQRNDEVLAPVEVLAQVRHLIGIHMRHGQRHRDRQVNDDRVLRRGLPHLRHRVADLRRKRRLRTGEALRRILKAKAAVRARAICGAQLRAGARQLHDLGWGLVEHLLALGDGGRVVQMHDGVAHAIERLERFGDDMFARLREHLHRHIVRDEIALDKRAAKRIFRFRCGRKSNLDLLEADLHEQAEERKFLVEAHRRDERLVAVAQIDAAPDGRMVERGFAHPVRRSGPGLKKLFAVLLVTFHGQSFPGCRIKKHAPLPKRSPALNKRDEDLRVSPRYHSFWRRNARSVHVRQHDAL